MSASIIKNRNFVFLWIGHLVSHAGDAVYAIALPWLMLELTGSKSLTALVSMSAYLPALLFGLLAGVIVDRYDRKWIMILSDVLRALLVVVVPLSLIYGFVTPLLIGMVTFFLSTFATLFYPARDSLIPQITSPEELPAANSAISISGQMSHLLGPLFAGIGMSFLGITHLFTADAISFLFSILMIYFISTTTNQNIQRLHQSQFQGILEGLRYVKNNRGLKALLILTFINNIFIMGPAIIGLPVFVREVLLADFSILAYMETAMAAGMILGSFIFWKALKRFNPVSILLFGIVMDGLTYSLLYFVNSSFMAILVLLVHGIGIPLITVARTTIIQTATPDKFLGRIFSMNYMAVMGTTAISIGFTGFILEFISADWLFLCIGICAALTVLFGLNSSMRNLFYNNQN